MVSCNTETVPSIAKEMAYVLWWTTGESLQPIRDNRVKFSSCAARTGTLHTARGAISAITISTGSHPIISRFTRGIYRQTQPARRYQTIWDVQPVLSYLSGLGPTENLDLKSLTLKVTLSVALVSAQRGQTLHMLNIAFMKDSSTSIECALPAHIKQSRPGYNPPLVILHAYPDDKSPCLYMPERVPSGHNPSEEQKRAYLLPSPSHTELSLVFCWYWHCIIQTTAPGLPPPLEPNQHVSQWMRS